MTVCVCAHVCVCVHRGLSVRTFSCEAWVPARSPAPPRGISFRQWPMPWQLWPLAFLDMSLHMEGKMVRPGKTPVAVVAFKGLCTCVFPVVPCELIASCKTPLTPFP